MKSLRTKLIISFSVLFVLVLTIMTVISVTVSIDSLKDEAERNLASLAEEGAKLTSTRITANLNVLNTISIRDDITSMDWEKQEPILKEYVARLSFLDIGVVLPSGTVYYTDGTISQLADREYIKKALMGESNVSDLLVSRVTKEVVLMYAVPLKQGDKIVGALVARNNGNTLSNITNDMKYGVEEGYAYMVNESGTVVAHPDSEKVLAQHNPIELSMDEDTSLKPEADLFTKIISEKSGVTNYHFQGKDSYVGYSQIEGSKWFFVITADEGEVLSAIPTMRFMLIGVSFLALILCTIFTYFLSKSIIKPIIDTADYATNLSKLDFTKDLPENSLSRKDEIGTLSTAFQTLTVSLRNAVMKISDSSEHVAASSEELTATSQELSTAAHEVTKTMEDIAKGATEQATSTEDGANKAFLLGLHIEKEIGSIKNLNDATDEVQHVVEEGLKELDILLNSTKECTMANQQIHDVIVKTNDSSNKISEVSNVITSIADKTNLLSLNAAIEAARAGEAGKGFAVVAEEIRKLAEQSSSSSKIIYDIVAQLQENSQDAVQAMERVTQIGEEQSINVNNTKEKYLIIDDAMEKVVKIAKELYGSSQDMEALKNGIVEALENLTAIAQENSAATEEASASMEEQSASTQEVAGTSQSLAQLAQDLQTIIDEFKI